MQAPLDQAVPHAARHMAVRRRRPKPGLLHHSDRGGPYAATDDQAVLAMQRMIPSMRRKGDWYDTAVVERCFATLEWEVIAGAAWQTRAEARAAIFEYIAVWYNRQRRYSARGYVSPAADEVHLVDRARAAYMECPSNWGMTSQVLNLIFLA